MYTTRFTVEHKLPYKNGKIVWEEYIQYSQVDREFDVIKSQEPYFQAEDEIRELEQEELEAFDVMFDQYTRTGEIDEVINDAYVKEVY